MKRTFLLTVGLWTFLAVPYLCLGGVITHACPTDSGDNCGHEETCASDPCSQTARTGTSQPTVSAPSLSHIALTPLFAPQMAPLEEIASRLHTLGSIAPSSLGSTQSLPLLI